MNVGLLATPTDQGGKEGFADDDEEEEERFDEDLLPLVFDAPEPRNLQSGESQGREDDDGDGDGSGAGGEDGGGDDGLDLLGEEI